ncbi:MAG: hypothetical protein FWG35_02675, partial [Spirochaetaceae bacterium]|nr:hypothetical protein [Spirochaetaceae bacterium]
MEITLGHLAVLAVVIVILAIYRKLDTGSRTLAQVQKYADKERGKLDAVMAEKVQKLKDLGIAMDVQEQTAKGILDRSKGIEENIQRKLGSLDAIEARIAEYDKALDELVQMTRRAEENTHRVKEESEFIDTVAKRIRAAESRLTEQEGRIPELVQRFHDQNSEALLGVQKNLMNDAAEKAASLAGGLTAAGEKAAEITRFLKTAEAENQRAADRVRLDIKNIGSEQVEKISLELAKIEKNYSVRLEEAARRGEALETQALTKLKEHIEGSLKNLSGELSGKIEAGRTDIEKKMNGLSAFIGTLRGTAEAQLEKITAENDTALKGYALNLKDRIDGLEASLYQAEKDVEEKTSRLEAVAQSAIEDYTAKIENIRSEARAQLE